MSRGIDSKLAALDALLAAAEKHLTALPEEKRYSSPAGAWNSVQILKHLCDTERGVAAYLSKKLQAEPKDIPRATIGTWVRYLLLLRALRNMKVKYRAPTTLAPPESRLPLHSTLADFKDARARLRAVASSFNRDMRRRQYFKHPRAGYLTIGQTLGFIYVHFERHLAQMYERSR